MTRAPDLPDVRDVRDVREVTVAAGGRVVVVSDLHLGPTATAASSWATSELARVLDGWTGPGVVVLAGNTFELLAGPNLDVDRILTAHARLRGALDEFLGDACHRVVCLIGNRDARLAWDEHNAAKLAARRVELAFAVELVIETGTGPRRVRVEHGHQLDAQHAFTDPRDPHDSPLGLHMAKEVLPALEATSPWLEGLTELDDPGAFPSFVASRMTYRRAARHLPWLLLPFLVAVLLKVPIVFSLTRRAGHAGAGRWARWSLLVASAVLADALVVLGGLFFGARRAWAAAGEAGIGARGEAPNDAPRSLARALALDGYAGLVTGHTHHPELTVLGDAFYANTGCCTDVVSQREARIGLPPLFLRQRELSWLELEAGADLHARLVHAVVDVPGATRLERALARPLDGVDAKPAVVAVFPQGPSWPPERSPARRLRRVRRIAAAAIALAGLIDLVSALTPPLRSRLGTLRDIVPLAVPQVAASLVALGGLALLLLARGVRRGQRHAWQLAVAILMVSVVLHVAKGVDLEEAVTALVVVAYLVHHRGAFRGRGDRPSAVKGLQALVIGGLTGAAAATLAVEVVHRGRPRPPLGHAVAAVVGRMAGSTAIALPDRLDDFLTPALLTFTVGLVVAAAWLLFRPAVARHGASGDDRARARSVVARYGTDTLAYFALRDDKRFFFWGESVIAYAVVGGVCLVSPDPIGPEAERFELWDAFHRFADEHAWPLAVMGACEEWLPVYRAAGMHDLYVGDEAIVDCQTFTLDGGQKKGLRQAVNRVAKYGYTISFHDPATIDPALGAALLELMTKSRRGDVERGFSMTLGRVFDPSDKRLLLAVAFGPDGSPAAFCQYVPAAGIDGYSLDLMRRADDDGPNGVTDFVVVETIRHLRENGKRGLALNFATMRAVLAGEAGDSLTQRVERWLLRRMSDSMQIESLWYFNAKYDPDWRPRYAVYDSLEHFLPAAMAVARAESFWELPIIGRFLVPSA